MIFTVNDGTEFSMNYEIIENILPQDTLFIHGNFLHSFHLFPG